MHGIFLGSQATGPQLASLRSRLRWRSHSASMPASASMGSELAARVPSIMIAMAATRPTRRDVRQRRTGPTTFIPSELKHESGKCGMRMEPYTFTKNLVTAIQIIFPQLLIPSRVGRHSHPVHPRLHLRLHHPRRSARQFHHRRLLCHQVRRTTRPHPCVHLSFHLRCHHQCTRRQP